MTIAVVKTDGVIAKVLDRLIAKVIIVVKAPVTMSETNVVILGASSGISMP